MMKRRWAAFLSILFLVLSVLGGNLTSQAQNRTEEGDLSETRIFDNAGLFSEEESSQMETEIASMRENMNMDVVIVTTDEAGGKTAKKYAEDFYVEGGYGTGNDYSGVLFLIDMDNRELYLLPVGKMNRFLTDKRWNAILDDAYNGAGQKDYGSCAQSFLDGVAKYYKAGIPGGQYNYDAETGKISVYRSIRWYEGALAALMGIIAGAFSCRSVVRKYSMKPDNEEVRNSFMAYRGESSFQYSNQTDDLINKSVTFVPIPRNPGGKGGGGGFSSGGRSTTHTSSGRTMGGGGRKF